MTLENEQREPIIRVRDGNVYYGDFHAAKSVSLDIYRGETLAMIGPSGCGKSTVLRCFNRMNDGLPGCRVTGAFLLEGEDINAPTVDVVELRTRVGMVFQRPNPFPKSVYDNAAYGPRIHGMAKSRADLDAMVEDCLRKAALWDEVKDKLDERATRLSGGQQQRLCIARAIAVNPEVILMDEPCSALDPIASGRIENLIEELRPNYAIVVVTHSMQQAARISQRTAYFHLGELVEIGPTPEIFTRPRREQTEKYITGKIG